MLKRTLIASLAFICGACLAVYGVGRSIDRAVTGMFCG